MSSDGRGFRVSEIPRNVRNVIQNIMETGCCQSEEEVYAMLKECRMDPNETVQKLLLQDTFHEVKRRKERRKETLNIREATDSRWRSGPFGRFGRGGRGSFPSRHSDVRRSRSSSSHEIVGSKPHGAGTDQPAQVSQPLSSPGLGGSLSNCLSSNYGQQSCQVTGPRGPTKEWKPKASSSKNAPVSGTSSGSDQSAASVAAETYVPNHGVHGNISDSEERSHISEEELDVSHIRDISDDNVIIPDHLQVAEAIKNVLCFGSFNTGEVLCQTTEDSAVGQRASDNNVVAPPEEEDSIGVPLSSTHVPETVPSGGAKVSSSPAVGESVKIPGITEHHMIHTPPAYGYAAEQMLELGNITSSDISDGQAHHASRSSNFTVQQPLEAGSANSYEQFYHSGVSDGHISPFAASTSYSGNFPFLPAEASDSLQEGGNHVLHSTAGYAPANQSGIMLSNIPATQPAAPLYRQPTGLPMPQYSPNYMPYGHYYPPFYASPSPSHQYVGNDAFLQQAQTSIYPATATGATAGVKFAIQQFKHGSHAVNPTHMSTSGGYGMYGARAAGHNAGSVAAAGNLGANGDTAGSQYRENNVYDAGQQTESSTVWIPASGRAISGLQATSYYNLPPQGQHVTFPLSQCHVSFASAYHPAQATTAAIVHPLLQHSQAMPGAVDMVRSPPAGVYHQPRHATQMNWPNNF